MQYTAYCSHDGARTTSTYSTRLLFLRGTSPTSGRPFFSSSTSSGIASTALSGLCATPRATAAPTPGLAGPCTAGTPGRRWYVTVLVTTCLIVTGELVPVGPGLLPRCQPPGDAAAPAEVGCADGGAPADCAAAFAHRLSRPVADAGVQPPADFIVADCACPLADMALGGQAECGTLAVVAGAECCEGLICVTELLGLGGMMRRGVPGCIAGRAV